MNNIVIIEKDIYIYPKNKNFRPSKMYPEYPFQEICNDECNYVYDMVRDGLRMMGYDNSNFGTNAWNPLGDIIHPGDKVLIKPNLVMDRNLSGNGEECLYTHPSVVAALIDYTYIALKGQGEIIVGDAPVQECDFEKLIKESGYENLIKYYMSKNINIRLIDFRELKSIKKNGVNYQTEKKERNGIIVNLTGDSEFDKLEAEQFNNLRITNYDPRLLKEHHNYNIQEYYINKEVLMANVFINVPKPKTHRKAGVTIALKNIVGINARKEYLPHHSNGSVKEGGDEYLNKSNLKVVKNKLLDARNISMQTEKKYFKTKCFNFFLLLLSFIMKIQEKDNYYEGNWYGNTTIGKTIVDLNKILLYADANGNMVSEQQRKCLTVADMIISGEKEGPLCPEPKKIGVIAIGENFVIFDEIISKLMGLKNEYFSTLQIAKKAKGKYNLFEQNARAKIISNNEKLNGKSVDEIEKNDIWYFQSTSGWEKAFMNKGDKV